MHVYDAIKAIKSLKNATFKIIIFTLRIFKRVFARKRQLAKKPTTPGVLANPTSLQKAVMIKRLYLNSQGEGHQYPLSSPTSQTQQTLMHSPTSQDRILLSSTNRDLKSEEAEKGCNSGIKMNSLPAEDSPKQLNSAGNSVWLPKLVMPEFRTPTGSISVSRKRTETGSEIRMLKRFFTTYLSINTYPYHSFQNSLLSLIKLKFYFLPLNFFYRGRVRLSF